MHHIYTTKAIIIKSLPLGEANKIYFLLTKDLGFIKASAQGVRLDKSKLKGHLEDFSAIFRIGRQRKRNLAHYKRGNDISEYFYQTVWRNFPLKNIFSLLLRCFMAKKKTKYCSIASIRFIFFWRITICHQNS